MYPDLMRAAGLWKDEREAVPVSLREDPVGGLSGAALLRDETPPVFRVPVVDRTINHALPVARNAGEHGQILLLRRPVGQHLGGVGVLGREHQPGGVLVEPAEDPEP